MLGWCRWIGWAPFWRWHWSNGERTQYWIVCNSRILRVLSFVCAELGVEYCDRFMAQGESLSSHNKATVRLMRKWGGPWPRPVATFPRKDFPKEGKRAKNGRRERETKKHEKWEAGEGDKSSKFRLPDPSEPHRSGPSFVDPSGTPPFWPLQFFDEILLDESVIG